jgi:hypothetical protein
LLKAVKGIHADSHIAQSLPFASSGKRFDTNWQNHHRSRLLIDEHEVDSNIDRCSSIVPFGAVGQEPEQAAPVPPFSITGYSGIVEAEAKLWGVSKAGS